MRLVRFTCIFTLLLATAYGQDERGAISGTLLVPGGEPFVGGTVQVKNVQTGTTSKAVTSAGGRYTIANLPAGAYDVSVSMQGVKPYTRKGVVLSATKTSEVNIRLEEGTQLSTLGEDALGAIADGKRHNPPSGPTPRTPDGKPDLSGIWWRPAIVDPGKPEWLPAAQAIAKKRLENNSTDSPQAHCLPSPVTRLGPLFQLSQTKHSIVLISDDESPGFHQLRLNRATHPKEPDTDLWYGDSVGHWEDDTLVVDRVSFKMDVWLDQEAHPHSEKLHVIERYRRADLGHLEKEITVEDPGVLAKPWVSKQVADLAPNEEIREFICAENNRDLPHMVGK